MVVVTRYKATVSYTTSEKGMQTQRQDEVFFEETRVRPMKRDDAPPDDDFAPRPPARRQPSAPRGSSIRSADPRPETERRLDELERKLDRVLKALERDALPRPPLDRGEDFDDDLRAEDVASFSISGVRTVEPPAPPTEPEP